ncbi:DNA-binding transcriptional regulator, MerR family [Microbispora rosea]|uniref:DNA-binding transcriptional regulator, MerR family n=1 Tax=Microbispora rosea TaxID=58117 RepID=A0A1N7HIW9_9ACTN|nr:MerR family transcriptional regulator [Microbispora rosea]GIH44899.1 MerR family transcriptional regulator [Microbispora rosea subsp. rosea]SIS24762.1 DNA-binding transcriptional regulator, MerR family [Microbispora rosea]
MFTIGDFARHGRVSVRMLHHYDAIGLLRPARVDPASGYRFYEAGQLARLNRITALKDLGFTLRQVRDILDEQVSAGELRGMLRLRQAELEAAMAAAADRLAQVEARLRTIESEGQMNTDDVVVKRIPAVRVAELSGVARSYEPRDIGPVVGPLFQELCRRLDEAGVTPVGPGIAYYEDAPGGDGILAHAAMPVAVAPEDGHDFAVVDLPAIERAATIVHRGPMDDVLSTEQTLARWIADGDHRSAGYARELYLEAGEDPAGWVTELQEPLAG